MFIKILKSMRTQGNADSIRKYYDNLITFGKVFFYLIIALISILTIYGMTIGLIYGIIILTNLYYDLNTGCPNNNPECNMQIKMMCYNRNMIPCYFISISASGFIFIIIITYFFSGDHLYNKCLSRLKSYHAEKKLINTANNNNYLSINIQSETSEV